ncbi:MAG: imidazole glycerol phosphate synthase subunit HisF [Deltaproteobacteria bacterium]|jgi:cyclase|nr:imidazole glycerol phosphate synthase subunit HisF [Deltaproteobacteria bacterium]
MLSKRLIPCLDVRDGLLTKGVKFLDNQNLGDPVEAARRYYLEGADEIVFYDITASAEGRGIFLKVVEKVAAAIFIPFSVGGGLSTVPQMRDVLLAGAEKISLNSAAVKNPNLIAEAAAAFGSQAVVLGLDARKSALPSCPSGYEVVINGGRVPTGKDALAWAQEAERLGVGEICLNSIDADGTKDGYELTITSLIARNVIVPVIASGGAGEPKHLLAALTSGGASAALVASIVHFREYSILELKNYLKERGCPVRPINW